MLWNICGAWKSAPVSVEVRLSSDVNPAADQDSVIQRLAHSQQSWRLLTREFVDHPAEDWCTPYDDLHVRACVHVCSVLPPNVQSIVKRFFLNGLSLGICFKTEHYLPLRLQASTQSQLQSLQVFFPEKAPASLAALLILPVTASGSQILTVLEQDVLVAGPFLPRRHLTKETICFNETGSHSETPFFLCVLGRKS